MYSVNLSGRTDGQWPVWSDACREAVSVCGPGQVRGSQGDDGYNNEVLTKHIT